jgi:putative intracellular protease/amidase
VQIAILLYPGVTALDAIGPYEVLRFIPGSELRFISREPGPIVADSGVLVLGATHSYDETPPPDILTLARDGYITGLDGKPFGSAGFVIVCGVAARLD